MSQNEKPNDAGQVFDWRALLTGLWTTLKHNWPYKLLALVLAITLWAGLISQEPSLTRPVTLEDTPIAVAGLAELRERGYVVLEGLNSRGQLSERATVRADVPQLQAQNVRGSDFQLNIDLSTLDAAAVTAEGPGDVEVRIGYTENDEHGTVTGVTPETVTLRLDQYISVEDGIRIPVSVVKTGTAPEGWYISDPTAQDLTYVGLTGPASLVNQVARAELVLNLDSVRLTEGRHDNDRSRFHLMDSDGNEIVNSQLGVHLYPSGYSIDSAYLSYDVYPTRTLTLSEQNLLTGETAEGYGISSVSVSETSILAAGPREVLDSLGDELTLVTPVTISANMTGTITRTRTILKPDDRIVRLIPSSVYVTVTIDPLAGTDGEENQVVENTGEEKPR